MYGVLILSGLIVFGTVVLLSILGGMYRKIGPNHAMIVYGWGSPTVVKGGGKLVWPLIQTARELSLELMSFDVAPQQDLYTNQGVAVTVEAVAQIKIKSDIDSILTAAEQLLEKDPVEREGLIRLVMEGHLRGIMGQLTVEQIVKEPEMVADKMRKTCAADMDKMGLEVVSFTIKEVRDKNDFIVNMGKPEIARIKKEADIAAAEAERDTAIRRAETMRAAAIAKANADQERTIAETASLTRQAEAQRDLEMKKAEYEASVQRLKAQADKAYEIQTNITQQQVIAEQVKISQVQKEQEVRVQEAEIARREKELIATVLKPAEMERQRIETLAQAEKQRTVYDAEGRAEAVKRQGTAEAEIIRIKGQAEAEIIQAKGQAEAEAMKLKATAFQEYNQAAVVDRLISEMPKVVQALAQPLNHVDRITVLSTGGNDSGINKVTADLGKIVTQVPTLVETLTGVKMTNLLGQLPGIGTRAHPVSTTAPQPGGDSREEHSG